MQTNWDSIVNDLKDRGSLMHEAREAGLVQCRSLIQKSARCIRNIHRHEFEAAESLLAEAKGTCKDAQRQLAPFPELYHAGYLHDAEKELVEAAVVLSIIRGTSYPTPDELGVGMMSFLNGMGEAASEVRRYCLDEMRKGDLHLAEQILNQMEAIYDDLITFDFPDAMTGGLRRTCDALRAVIERTRSDLTATVSQRKLIDELQATRSKLAE